MYDDDMMIYNDSGNVLNPNGLSLVFSVFMFVASLVTKDRCQPLLIKVRSSKPKLIEVGKQVGNKWGSLERLFLNLVTFAQRSVTEVQTFVRFPQVG